MPRRTPQLAKLARPRLHNAVARRRLFRLLDEKREHACIWLSGPPGAGKTTLVASYCEHLHLPGLWYHVDAGDADPSTFFYYLTEAARSLTSKKRPLPLLTPEYLQDVPGFARRYFRDLCARLPRPAVMVLDNFQEAPPDCIVQRLVAIAIAEVPPGVTLIVVSRSDPPEGLARHLASEALTRLGWESLRLTLDEAGAIARARGARDEGMIRELHHSTGGWAAGMTLLLERMSQGLSGKAAGELSHEAVFDYFASQIFSDASTDVRQVLMRTSLFGSFSLAMAESVSGHASCRALLEGLCDRQLFTYRKAGRSPTYQYHDLFREFLRRNLEATYSAEELRALYRQAGRLLVEMGLPSEALPLLSSADDWDAAIAAIIQAAPTLLAQGRWQTLQEWIERLPGQVTDADPWLLYWLGLARMQIDLPGARGILRRAFSGFVNDRQVAGQLLCAAAAVRAIYFEYEDFARMDEWIVHIDRLLAAHPVFPDPGAELFVHGAMLLAATYRQPAHPALPLCRQRVGELLDADIDVNQRVAAAIALLSHFSIGSDFLAGEPLIQRISPLLEAPELTALNRTYWWLYVGYHYHLLARRKECEAAFDRCESIALESGLVQAEVVLNSLRCYHFAQWNDSRSGPALLVLKKVVNPSRSMDLSQYHLACMMLAQQRREGGVAAHHAKEGLAAASGIGSPFFDIAWRLIGAAGLLAGGEVDLAEQWIDEAHCAARGTFLERFDALIYLLRSELACRRGQVDGEVEWLRMALTAGKRDCADRYFRWAVGVKDAVLARALERQIDVAYAQRLIREFAIAPPSPAPQAWPWRVRILALGGFRIEIDGEPPAFRHKAPKKPIALLKAVIALGGSNVPEYKLWDALWPGEDGGAAHEAFAASLHRLRKLLKHNDAILLQEGRVSLDPRQCWVDALAADAVLAELDDRETVAPGDWLSRVWQIYRGPFLPEDQDASWAIPLRERLRSRFLRCVARGARQLLEAGDVDAAAGLYRRGIETDVLAEELYQGLMICLLRLERRAEAMAVFRGLRQTLSITLGVPPSPQSERLFRAAQARDLREFRDSVPNRSSPAG